MQRLAQWFAPITRVRFLRNLLLLALIVPLIIPVFYQLWELPQYRKLLIDSARQDAVLAARHMAGMLLRQNAPLSPATLPEGFARHAVEVMTDFGISRLRLYGAQGEVLHSTGDDERGHINHETFFRDQVMGGEVYTELHQVRGRGETFSAVVMTYVPVMGEGRFLGALAIDYDISARQAAFDDLYRRSILVTLLLSAGLLWVVLIALLRAGRDVAQREAAQQALADREALLHSITASAQDAIIMIDDQSRVVYWNAAAEALFGYRTEEVLGHELHPLIAPAHYLATQQYAFAVFRESGAGPVIGKTLELTGRRKDGSEFPVELSVSAVRRASGWHAIGILRGISERKRIERHLQMASRVMTHAREGIMVVDAVGNIEMVNPAFTDITGYTAEDVVGRNPSLLQSGRHDRSFYENMWRAIEKHDTWQGEVWNRRKDGDIYPEMLSISVVRNGGGQVANYIGIFSDITRRKDSEQRLERLAFHDPLTGLANRLLFMDRLRQALRQARRDGAHLAVLFMDLDHFKEVNDRHGHHVGDLLLQQVAARLQALLREQDTVARLGGDEFVVLLQGIGQTDEVGQVADKMLAALLQPFVLEGYRCQVGGSIGVSFYPADADSAEGLVDRADEAMYRAKQGGRNRVCFYRQGI